MIDVMNIGDLYRKGNIILTHHFLERINKRKIKLAQVKTAINMGDIIEQYPNDYPHPSCLMFWGMMVMKAHCIL